jgi:hypothetical protein
MPFHPGFPRVDETGMKKSDRISGCRKIGIKIREKYITDEKYSNEKIFGSHPLS